MAKTDILNFFKEFTYSLSYLSMLLVTNKLTFLISNSVESAKNLGGCEDRMRHRVHVEDGVTLHHSLRLQHKLIHHTEFR